MSTDELKELEDYYNNLLLMGETFFIYDCFRVGKTNDGKWVLITFLSELHDKDTEIKIPSFIQIIGKGAFTYYKGYIPKIVIPEGVEKIGKRAFMNCNLLDIRFPHTLKEIDNQAFYECYLEQLYIPNSVKSIGEMAFYGNRTLRDICLPTGVTLDFNTFELCGDYCDKDSLRFEIRQRFFLKERRSIRYINNWIFAFNNSPFKDLVHEYIHTYATINPRSKL